jgi:hypothetical protein
MAMVHPIFSVLITRPELVMDHVAGYAALVQEEASTVGLEVAKRAIAWGVAVIGLLVFLILAGVAVMLGRGAAGIPLGPCDRSGCRARSRRRRLQHGTPASAFKGFH